MRDSVLGAVILSAHQDLPYILLESEHFLNRDRAHRGGSGVFAQANSRAGGGFPLQKNDGLVTCRIRYLDRNGVYGDESFWERSIFFSGESMKRIRTLVLSAFVGALVCCGCSQKATKTAADVAMSISPWEAGTANPLMAYVPEDAPMIVATNRSDTMENEGIRNLLWLLGEALELREDLGDEIGPLLSDYRENAAAWGLDPEGKVDMVFYLRDSRAITHITVADDLKAMEGFEHFVQLVSDEGEVTVRDEDGWRIYRHEADKDFNDSSYLAVHVKGGVMSVLHWTGEIGLPSEVLNVAGKPFRAESGKDDVLLWHVDFARFGEFVTKVDWIADFLNERYFDGFITKKDQERWMTFCRENAKFCEEHYQGRSYVVIPYEAHEAAVDALGDIEVDRSNVQDVTMDEWIAKLGTTNIKDDVCIDEFKSIFKDVPSADLAISVSKNGKVGGRIGASLVAVSLYNDIKSLITEHAILKDDAAKTYGYIGLKIYDALRLNEKYLNEFITRDWKCEQIHGAFDAIKESNSTSSAERMMRKLGEFGVVLKEFESLSFMLSDFAISRMGSDGSLPEFLVHMRNAPEAFETILGYFDMPVEDGKVATLDAGDLQPNVLVKGRDMLAGSSKYDLLSQDVKMAKDRFAAVHISKKIIDTFVPYGDLGGASTSFLTAYDLSLSLEDHGIVFAIEPAE